MDSELILSITPENCNVDYIQTENTNSFNRICRTCLTGRGELRSLFEESLNEMLMSFTTIQATITDGLPPNICTQCILNISRAYNFKQQAESSDTTLRHYVSSNFQHSEDPLVGNVLQINYTNNTAQPVQPNISQIIVYNTEKPHYCLPDHNPQNSKQEIKHEITGNHKPENPKLKENISNENFQSDNDTAAEEDTNGSEKSNALNCDICSITFKTVGELNKHLKTHSKTKCHVCLECKKSFQYKAGLRQHMRSHGIGERKHECRQCGKRFYELNELVIHERGHTGERPVVCETCGKTFADPRSLAKHIKIHTGEKKYECDICNKRFIHSYTLTAHKRVHTGEKPYVCSICGHACATSPQLTLHVRTHTREKPYACSVCPKRFTSKSGLSTHQLTHTGERKYICSVCGKGSRTSTDLNSHIRTHTGEKPYECKVPLCLKKYKTHSQLSAHMRTHTGEKNHRCNICGKAFADTSQLKSHVNIHTGLKPYVCATCGHRFTQSGSLHTHMKSHR